MKLHPDTGKEISSKEFLEVGLRNKVNKNI
jgi:hypothetical protein